MKILSFTLSNLIPNGLSGETNNGEEPTFIKEDDTIGVYKNRSINKTRKFIEKNFPIVLSTWRETDNGRRNTTERIFRNRSVNEPVDYWNNNKWSEEWKGCLPIRKWTELEIWLYIFYKNILSIDKVSFLLPCHFCPISINSCRNDRNYGV